MQGIPGGSPPFSRARITRGNVAPVFAAVHLVALGKGEFRPDPSKIPGLLVPTSAHGENSPRLSRDDAARPSRPPPPPFPRLHPPYRPPPPLPRDLTRLVARSASRPRTVVAIFLRKCASLQAPASAFKLQTYRPTVRVTIQHPIGEHPMLQYCPPPAFLSPFLCFFFK